MSECGFTLGQRVFYRPSENGYARSVMTHDLRPGEQYEIAGITMVEGRCYVSLRGQVISGGGLHWEEFSVD